MAPIRVYLSLGSNVGAREENLKTAIAALSCADVEVVRVSSMYDTEPVDYLDQAWFLNCVVEAQTHLSARALLHALQGIETQMGSKKWIVKGPRLIDIDLLLYGEQTIETPELQVPHPRMTQRRFVLVPLAEIAPGVRHPSWNGTAQELLQRAKNKSEVRRAG
jgi:2-amino-4-hydroxy-6-hydroxymethyldihydropteridine diphosphokinase